MSCVVAIMTPEKFIIAGDTQLNDDNGEINLLGAKVFPIYNNCIGITGDYLSIIEVIDEIGKKIDKNSKFDYVLQLFSESLRSRDIVGNIIVIRKENSEVLYSTLSDKEDWNFRMTKVNSPDFRILSPPDYKISDCKKFIASNNSYKEMLINCLRDVAFKSKSVNNKILGLELNDNNLFCFTENLEFEELYYRFSI